MVWLYLAIKVMTMKQLYKGTDQMEIKQRQYPDQPAPIIMQDSYGCCWPNKHKKIRPARHDGMSWYIWSFPFQVILITMVGRRTEAQNAIKHPSPLMAAKDEMKMNGILEMTAFDNLL